jgi:hypothetical protein
MMKGSWTDHVRNEEALQRVKEERNVLQTINRRKSNFIVSVLLRDILLKRVVEGKIGRRIQVTE